MDNLRAGHFTVTRRFMQIDDGTMRICDIVRNNRSEEANANISLSFNVNFGVQSTRTIADPKKTERTLAAVITDSQNRNMVSVFAGRGSKCRPTSTQRPTTIRSRRPSR